MRGRAKTTNYRLSDKEHAALEMELSNPAPDNSNSSLTMRRRVCGACVDPSAFKLLDPSLKVS